MPLVVEENASRSRGTAISYSSRDMPPLSVDIDHYVPVQSRKSRLLSRSSNEEDPDRIKKTFQDDDR